MAQGLSNQLNGYGQMQTMLNRPTTAEATAQGLADATANIPQNTLAGGLVQGLAQGLNIGTKNREGKKRDKVMDQLLAQQERAMEQARHADELAGQLSELKAGEESRKIIQDNIDLSLDSYQSTGDLSMLNETLNNEAAMPFRKMFERQISDLGGVYQGITATPEGDLMPYGLSQDGARVYGKGIPVEQGYSQGYLTAKQAKDLDMKKQQADLAKTEAETGKLNAEATTAGREKAPAGYEFTANGQLSAIKGGPADPEKPVPVTGELAGKLALVKQGQDSLAHTKAIMFDKQGELNRGVVTELALLNSVPFGIAPKGISEDARKLYTEIYNWNNAKLRLESGAAVPEVEVQRSTQAYIAGILDNAETASSKLQAPENYFNDYLALTGQEGRGGPRPSGDVPTGSALQSPEAANIKAQYQAGKLSREQAKQQLQALGAR